MNSLTFPSVKVHNPRHVQHREIHQAYLSGIGPHAGPYFVRQQYE